MRKRLVVRLRSLSVVAVVVLSSVGAPGCGGAAKSALPLTPVSGKVTLDGKPLPEADMEFIPVGETPGQGGIAKTNTDGGYLATTMTGQEGLPAGEYQVVISKRELPPGAVAPEKDTPRALIPFREVLPPTYSDRLSSSLKATVTGGGDSFNHFGLKSKPGK